MKSIRQLGILLLVLSVCTCGLVRAEEVREGLDTTRVREPRTPPRKFSRVLADIPGEILKLPVRTIRLVAYAASSPPVSNVTKLINFSGEAKNYIPVVGYSSDAGLKLGFGLRKLTRKFWDDHLDFKWYYSTNDYQSYQFRLKVREATVDWMGIDLYYRYKKRPRESFYGIGASVSKEKEASYTLESSEFRLDLPFHTAERLSVGVTGGFILSNLYDGHHQGEPGNLDSIMMDPKYALTPGRLDGARFINLGLIFDYDGRNNGGQPSRGFQVLSRWVRYLGTGRSEDQNYSELKLDIRHYLNVWKKRIVATRLYLQRFDGDKYNGRDAPINLLSSLGGEDGLRGFSSGRFINNDLVLGAVEWRFPVWFILDGFVFLEGGRVYTEITEARVFDDWKSSTGFGLRVWNIREVSFSGMVGFSEEGPQFYISGGVTW